MRVIAENAHRYPVSAQCKILGVPRSTYYHLIANGWTDRGPDPATEDVVSVYEGNRRVFGARKIKLKLDAAGKTLSRRRITRIMKENSLVSAYSQKKYKQHGGKVNEADLPNVINREFCGYEARTHIAGDLTYVRVGGKWCYVCLLVDLANREIVGHSAGDRKDARLVKSAFATLGFPLTDVEVFHSDRGSEFDNMALDELFDAFGIARSLSRKGNPYDNAVVESTNHILKRELVYRECFRDLRDLQVKLGDYVHWYNNFRPHSTLGGMTPVEFREKSLKILSKKL